ncbi:MAG: NosD domain-containing protein [Candidatus Micrarchaeaceae archaeon]
MYNNGPSTQGPPSQVPPSTGPSTQGGGSPQPVNPSSNAQQTPPVPAPAPSSASGVGTVMQQQQAQNKPKPKGNVAPFIGLIVIIIIVVAGVLIFYKSLTTGPSATTSVAVTSTVQGVGTLSSCTTINSPGKYFLASNIKTSILQGACINVQSSDVSLICDSNRLTGSGPFVDTEPYTYAIEIDGMDNVTVSGCTIRNFSYGIYSISSNGLYVNDNNMSVNYMSNIYLNNTQGGTISYNHMSKSSSTQGSLFLTNGTSGLDVENNTIQFDQYYGINVNASNNRFVDNYINGTQYSLRCSAPNGFVISSSASSNVCYNDTGCGFLVCKGINIPANLSKISLSSVITSCGVVNEPGSYELGSNLNMKDYVNTSNPYSFIMPCIDVESKNVEIDCAGHSITNSTTAILASGKQNITLENCIINNSTTGISLSNVTVSKFMNLSLRNDTYGISLAYNTSSSTFSNILITNGMYGVLIDGSFSNTFQMVNSSLNSYGFYLRDDSFSNVFNKDVALNNSAYDVYATNDSASLSYDLMESTTCGSTDAQWTTCKNYIEALLPYIPVSSCTTISKPGNYLMQDNIVDKAGKCLQIKADNVRLNCAGHTVSAGFSISGPALSVSGSSNVSAESCGLADFGTAVKVTNSSFISLSNMTVTHSNYGIILGNVTGAYVYNNLINGTQNDSIYMLRTYSSSVYKNTLSYGQSKSIALLINDSQNNMVYNNTGSSSYIGMELEGKSSNNNIDNNTMQGSTYYDYACFGNSALGAENGGINYGVTKLGCNWLAAITVTSPTVQCGAATSPSLFLLSQDAKYSTGTTCFSSFSNTTVINCAGHTVIATNGGTFADFVNSYGSKIENCFLKGFDNTIMAKNSTITILNNTILDGPASAASISVYDSKFGASILSNNVSTPGIGILLSNLAYAKSGSLQNNMVEGAHIAYSLSNVSNFVVKNNTALGSDYTGLSISGSTADQFQDNNFMSSNTGIECMSSSIAAINNTDIGGNHCTLNVNCLWIKSSSETCP